MGCSTNLYTHITFVGKTYNSKEKVERDLKDTRNLIAMCKRELYSYAITTDLKSLLDKEDIESGVSLVSAIEAKVYSTLEALEEYYDEESELSLLLDRWEECHDKDDKAIPPPENIHWDSSFLDGDFIKIREE